MEPKKPEPRTLKAWLVGHLRMEIGDVELDTESTIENFANAAYNRARGSLKRLLPQSWSVEIVDEGGQRHLFPLTRWNKLQDHKEVEKRREKAVERAKQKAEQIYGRS